MQNKWYATKLILQCKVGPNDLGPWICDEQIRLIRAPDDDVALEKALRLGKEQEHSYENAQGDIVRWEFVGLANLEELTSSSIDDGTEITSCLFEEKDPSRLVRPRDALTVSWAQRNRHRYAYEIIEENAQSNNL